MSQPPTPNPSSGRAKQTAANSAPSRSKLQAFLQLLGQLGGILLAVVPLLLNLLRKLGQLALTALKGLAKLWAAILPKIRTVLPATWNAKLPDAVITAIAIGLLALLLWLPTTVLSDRRAVAQVPEQTDNSTKPVAVDPNAKRVAAIQEQLTEVSTEYTDSLIEAVQANFPRNRLTLRVNDSWYSLESTQRERLANELLKRSQKLAFQTLEIADLKGTVVARTPVVGKQMVLLMTVKE
jgi:hypothetical protein